MNIKVDNIHVYTMKRLRRMESKSGSVVHTTDLSSQMYIGGENGRIYQHYISNIWPSIISRITTLCGFVQLNVIQYMSLEINACFVCLYIYIISLVRLFWPQGTHVLHANIKLAHLPFGSKVMYASSSAI